MKRNARGLIPACNELRSDWRVLKQKTPRLEEGGALMSLSLLCARFYSAGTGEVREKASPLARAARASLYSRSSWST